MSLKKDDKIIEILILFVYILLNVLSGKTDIDSLKNVYKSIKENLPKEESKSTIKKLKDIAKTFLKTQGIVGILTTSVAIYDIVDRVSDVYLNIKYNNKENLNELNKKIVKNLVSKKIMGLVLSRF